MQEPRLCSIAPYVSSTGAEAVELAGLAGLVLDPWEALVLEHALGERADGKWAAFEVGLVVPRQNGKGAVLEARALAGLFLLGERLITHSAHQFDTALEAFRRLEALIEGTPDFSRRVRRVSHSHGEEGIELKGGQRIRFRTRTKGGGRGFTGDCLILDEAMILPEASHGTLFPTLAARPNPQVLYTGSAVDQNVHEHGVVFARIRQRGIAGDDPALTFLEWSVPQELHVVDERVATDPDSWAIANPGLGIRISTEYVEREQRSLDARNFAVERLGAGDWPDPDPEAAYVIDLDTWLDLEDLQSKPVDPVCFAFDVKSDRSAAAIAVGGRRRDSHHHLEVVNHERGTGWVADRIAELVADHKPAAVVCPPGPAAALLPSLKKVGVEVKTLTEKEHAQACGMLFDGVDQATVHHLGTAELVAALKGAEQRPVGDAWVWERKSNADISPLTAVTAALWAAYRPARRMSWRPL